jgi:hypothetical protein
MLWDFSRTALWYTPAFALPVDIRYGVDHVDVRAR